MLAANDNVADLYLSTDGGYEWNTKSVSYVLKSITMNATGGAIFATADNGHIYKSIDLGSTWLLLEPVGNWTSIATDSSGQHVLSTSLSGMNFTSTGGEYWVQISNEANFTSVAADYAGSLFFAVRLGVYGVYIYSVEQQQTTFVQYTIPGDWNYIACSGIGNILAVIVSTSLSFNSASASSFRHASQRQDVQSTSSAPSTGSIYMSINSGNTWKVVDLAASTWTAVAIDGDGTTMAASSYDLGMYISNDYGRNWYITLDVQYVPWGGLSISSTGKTIACVTTHGQIWVGVGQEPTSAPTKPPSPEETHSVPSFLAFPSADSLVIAASVIPPALLILAAILVRLLRSERYTQEASALRAWPVELVEIIIQSFTWLLFMQALFGVSDDQETWILIVAKVPVIVTWCVLCTLLVVPYHVTPANAPQSRLILSDYLHTPSMLDTLLSVRNTTWYALIMFLSVLDLKFLCYMPWKRTSFTDLSYGFPNLFTARCCLYSSCVASIIQTIGSVVLLATNEEHNDVPAEAMFVTFNLLNVVRSLIQIAMFFTLFDLIRREEEITAQSLLARSTGGGDMELHVSVADVKSRFVLHGEDEDSKLDDMEEAIGSVALHETRAVMNPLASLTTVVEEGNTDYKQHKAKTRHADETLDILRSQLKNLGARPLEYITLQEIQAELDLIVRLVNAGESYDDGRFDYLLMCMELNPEYRAQKAEEARRWREAVLVFAEGCLDEMRGFIPPNIFTMTESSLIECGVNVPLTKRIMTKKCLWLIRIHPSEIERLHEAELTGRFNPEAQNLDIVELAAIYASLPLDFQKDPMEKKKRWRGSVESKLRSMMEDKEAGRLSKSKQRSDCYTNQPAVFAELDSLHVMDGVGLKDAVDRKSFLDIKRRHKSVEVMASNVDEATGRRVSRLVSYATAEEIANCVVFDTICEEEEVDVSSIPPPSPLQGRVDFRESEDVASTTMEKPPPGILQGILDGRARLKRTKK